MSLLDYSRHFPHGEPQIVATRLEQCDHSIALTNSSATRQCLQCDTLPERHRSQRCAIQTSYALSATFPLSGFAQDNYPHTLHGIERSRPPRVVDSMPTLLHLSIFLFIAGLIDFLLLTNKIVAFCVLGSVSAFSFACLIFTALSSLYPGNPRRTSLPEFAWRVSLIIFLAILVSVVEIGGLFCRFLSSIWTRAPLCAPEHPSALATWRAALEGQIRTRQRSRADGLWFVARIPGSDVFPCTTSPIPSSMEVPSNLLTSDIPDTPALTEESRRNELHASLKSLWYCGRAYHRLGTSAPLPHYVRDVFASPEMTSRIQNEPDPTARLIGRCFASLIAKKLSSVGHSWQWQHK